MSVRIGSSAVQGAVRLRLRAAAAVAAVLFFASSPGAPQSQEDLLKKLQEMQKQMQGMSAFGQTWEILQKQCELDKLNPLYACLPVTVTLTDKINEETKAQEPSGLLPNTKPKYITYKRLLYYTATGKGKLLYKKDFSDFRLLTSATPQTTAIQTCQMYTQGYHFEGTNARPVRYHSELMTGKLAVHWPFQFSIQYPFEVTGPAEEATHNTILSPTRIVLANNVSGPDQFGSQLPNEYVKEPMVTPEIMKKLVAEHGFEKSYQWTEREVHSRDRDEGEEHWLTIKVVIGEPCADPPRIAVRTRDGMDKYCFSEGTPGKLEITFEADVTPASLAEEVTWTLPELEGSTRTIVPPEAKGRSVTVTYAGLPQSNAAFGPKTVTATVKKDRCEAQAQKEVRLFFPTFAKNNPGGAAPNWFYYWSQTAARVGPARFGGGSSDCGIGSGSRDLGFYGHREFDQVYYICDLKALGPEFPFVAKRVAGDRWADLRVTGIDTFGVACLHENDHFSHFDKWWKPYRVTGPGQPDINHNSIKDDPEFDLDADGDLIPDALEEGLHLDPKKRNTYGIGPNGDDEEALCWFAEAKWIVGSADKQDWAKPGKQWK